MLISEFKYDSKMRNQLCNIVKAGCLAVSPSPRYSRRCVGNVQPDLPSSLAINNLGRWYMGNSKDESISCDYGVSIEHDISLFPANPS